MALKKSLKQRLNAGKLTPDKNDFERYENNTLDDPFLSDLLVFVKDHFEPVDVYEAPKEWYQSAGHQVLSFIVFKKN